MQTTAKIQPLFCDWVTLIVPVENLPTMGRQLWIDEHGVIIRDAPRALFHRTSADTNFKIMQINDKELWIDGNLGRFRRGDNLFGYSVKDCLELLPELLNSLQVRASGVVRLTRIDLTENLSVGSGSVSRFTHWAGGQRLKRHKPTCFETGVAWGLGSKHWSAKIYDKAADLKRTKKSGLAQLIGNGIARREITLRQKALEKFQLTNPADWLEGTEQIIMNCIFQQLDKGGCSIEQLGTGELSPRIESAIHAWRNGYDWPAAHRDGKVSRATLFRLRREVLDAAGIDLFIPSDIRRLPVRVHEIKPVRLEVPHWYEEYTQRSAA